MGSRTALVTTGFLLLSGVLAACASSGRGAASESSTPVEPSPTLQQVPVDAAPGEPESVPPPTATPDPGFTPSSRQSRPLPTATADEREASARTRLYLAAFQSDYVYVIDPLSGHALRQIPVSGDGVGVAVSPDGTRLYIVESGAPKGRLRVIDTATWNVVHLEAVRDAARLLGGNSITLSPDGRWLVVLHYSYSEEKAWRSVFDTQRLQFLPETAWSLEDCDRIPVSLAGSPDAPLLYIQCQGFVAALETETLAPVWRAPLPNATHPDLVLSPDGERLYGLYPKVDIGYGVNRKGEGVMVVEDTALRLLVWEAATGNLLGEVHMKDMVSVPRATIGRGEGAYLAISPEGEHLYVGWEDRVWRLSTSSLEITGEVQLPTAADGMALSVDGRELYLLPSTAGDLEARKRGMWTLDAQSLEIVRHASDWPDLTIPFFFAAPAPGLKDGEAGRGDPQPRERASTIEASSPITPEPNGPTSRTGSSGGQDEIGRITDVTLTTERLSWSTGQDVGRSLEIETLWERFPATSEPRRAYFDYAWVSPDENHIALRLRRAYPPPDSSASLLGIVHREGRVRGVYEVSDGCFPAGVKWTPDGQGLAVAFVPGGCDRLVVLDESAREVFNYGPVRIKAQLRVSPDSKWAVLVDGGRPKKPGSQEYELYEGFQLIALTGEGASLDFPHSPELDAYFANWLGGEAPRAIRAVAP